MFTATLAPAIEKLVKSYIRRPVIVNIGPAGNPVDKVKQVVYMLSHEAKKKKLLSLLDSGMEAPIIVFVNMKKGCDLLPNHSKDWDTEP